MPDHAMKRCRKCGEVKPLGQFTRDRSKRDGRRASCGKCERERDRRRYPERRDEHLEYFRQYYLDNGEALREYQRQYRAANPEKLRERDRRYYQDNREAIAVKQRQWEDANREKLREQARRRAARLREAVLEHYGRVCACPGCYSTENLVIDHINGDGRQHRAELFGEKNRKVGGGVRFHSWLVKNGFPAGLQTLCSRCNTSKGTSDRCWLGHDLEYDVENDAW
jgi:hypothetical protein